MNKKRLNTCIVLLDKWLHDASNNVPEGSQCWTTTPKEVLKFLTDLFQEKQEQDIEQGDRGYKALQLLAEIYNSNKVYKAEIFTQDFIHQVRSILMDPSNYAKPVKFPSGGTTGQERNYEQEGGELVVNKKMAHENKELLNAINDLGAETLNADNFFKYAKCSDNQILDTYLKDIKGIYHSPDINKALEQFAAWLTDRGTLIGNEEQTVNVPAALKHAMFLAKQVFAGCFPSKHTEYKTEFMKIYKEYQEIIISDEPAAATSKNFFEQNEAQKNCTSCKPLNPEHYSNLIIEQQTADKLQERLQHAEKVIQRGHELQGYVNANFLNIKTTGHLKATEILERLIRFEQACEEYRQSYSNQDIKGAQIEEKEAINKKLTCAGEQEADYFAFLDAYARNNTSYDSWAVARVSMPYKALNELRENCDLCYKELLQNRVVTGEYVTAPFVPPGYQPRVHVEIKFRQSLRETGINPTSLDAYEADNGLRIIKYTANGVAHLSIRHPQRLPSLVEVQYFRDIFYPDLGQMAYVIGAKDPQIGESGNDTITLIQLFYK